MKFSAIIFLATATLTMAKPASINSAEVAAPAQALDGCKVCDDYFNKCMKVSLVC